MKSHSFTSKNGEVILKLEKEVMFVLFFKIFINEKSDSALADAIEFMEKLAKTKKCKAIAYDLELKEKIKEFHSSETLPPQVKFWFNKPFYYKLLPEENLIILGELYKKIHEIPKVIETFDAEERIEIKKITVDSPFLMFHYFNENFGMLIRTESGEFAIEFISQEKIEKMSVTEVDSLLNFMIEHIKKINKKNRLYKIFEIKKNS